MRRVLGFARDERGVAAVEFALTGPIFFALVMGIVELAFFFFAWSSLDAGLVEASRIVRTGSIRDTAGGAQADAFKRALCDAVVLPECTARMVIDVRVQSNFSSATATASPADASAGNVQFATGKPLSVMSARAFYRMPNVFAGFFFETMKQSDGNLYISTLNIFRNEPYYINDFY